MIIISGVQGVGKTTLIKLLLEQRPMLQLSISSTTRPPRHQEIGNEYDFVTMDEFKLKRQEEYFIEEIEVHGHYYGTPKKYFTVNRVFNVTACSIQDFEKLISNMKNQYYISIFITAPLPLIQQRIINRLDVDCIVKKMKFAEKELMYAKYFKYIITNDGAIEEALNHLLNIVDKYLTKTKQLEKFL